MNEAERAAVRELLIRYERALRLTETLAIGLLDSVQPDSPPLTPEQARARRRTVGEAISLVAGGVSEVEQMWSDLGLERRIAAAGAPLPPNVPADRRRRAPAKRPEARALTAS